VDNLPSRGLLLQNDCAAVQESGTIIEMESGHRYCSHHLKLKVPRLDIHVRRLCAAGPNAVEYLLEESLEFIASGGAMRKLPWIENSRVIGECGAEVVPIQIVKCPNEVSKSLSDLRFCIFGRSCRAGNTCQGEQ